MVATFIEISFMFPFPIGCVTIVCYIYHIVRGKHSSTMSDAKKKSTDMQLITHKKGIRKRYTYKERKKDKKNTFRR